jgi:hypothetical protein
MVKLSPSSLKLFRECPRCFWLNHNKDLKRPEGIFPSLPGGMDRILKAHFDSFRDKGKMPPELKELAGVKLFDNVELLKIWTSNLKGVSWADAQGHVLRGAVDCILVKGKKLIVLDFKTRGYPVKEDTADVYHDQLDVYNFLLRKNGYETEDYGYLLFYHPESVDDSGHVKFHAELIKMEISVKNAEKLFSQALACLHGKMPKAADECGFCAWHKKMP